MAGASATTRHNNHKFGEKLSISGLDKGTDKQQLRDFFESLGAPCWRAHVVKDAEEDQSRGFGWVEFRIGLDPPDHPLGEHYIDGKLCILGKLDQLFYDQTFGIK